MFVHTLYRFLCRGGWARDYKLYHDLPSKNISVNFEALPHSSISYHQLGIHFFRTHFLPLSTGGPHCPRLPLGLRDVPLNGYSGQISEVRWLSLTKSGLLALVDVLRSLLVPALLSSMVSSKISAILRHFFQTMRYQAGSRVTKFQIC